MTKERLRWEPWPAETGASRAVGLSGNTYIARPREEGGRQVFALFYGGFLLRTFNTELGYRRFAEETERVMQGKGTGP